MRFIERVGRLVPFAVALAFLSRYVPVYLPGPINLTLDRIAIIAIAILGLLLVLHSPKVSLTTGDLSFQLLFVLLTASTAWSWYPATSINRTFDFTFYALLYLGLLPYQHHVSDDLAHWWKVFLGVGSISLLIGVFYFIHPAVGRVLDINANTVARHLIAFLPMFVVQAGVNRHQWVRTSFALFSAVAAVILVSSGSRSGTLVFCLLIVPLVYLYARASNKRFHEVFIVGVLFVAGAAAVLAVLLVFSVNASALLPNVTLSNVSPGMVGHDRFAMYVLIAELLPRHWLVGIGYGAFQPEMATVHRKGFVIHNLFLRVWLGAGILAVILLGQTIFYSIQNYLAAVKQSATTEASVQNLSFVVALLGLVMLGMFNPILTSPVFVTLLVLGLSTTNGTEHDSRGQRLTGTSLEEAA